MGAPVPGRLNTSKAKVTAIGVLSLLCAGAFAQGLVRQFTTLDDFGPALSMSAATAKIAEARPAPDYAVLDVPAPPAPVPKAAPAAATTPREIDLAAIEPAPEAVTVAEPLVLTPESLAVDASAIAPPPPAP